MTAAPRQWTIPRELSAGVIPSLDGFRALAIVWVMLWHLRLNTGLPEGVREVISVLFNGTLGVRVFFVLSGFLITTLLLKEKIGFGSIAIGKFYQRRMWRIFPPFYAYLLVVLLLNASIGLGVDSHSWISAALYISNFANQDVSWYTGHSWSLSVEEQFYLLWPLLLSLKSSLAMNLVLVLALLVPVLRIVVHFNYTPAVVMGTGFPFFDHADALFIGALGAWAAFTGRVPWPLLKRYRLEIALGGAVLCMTAYYLLLANVARPVMIPFAPTVTAGIILVVILSCLEPSSDAVFGFLNHPAVRYTGRISYSLYLWQQLFLPGYFGGYWSLFPVNIVLAVGAAMLSYYTVERLAMGARRKLAVHHA